MDRLFEIKERILRSYTTYSRYIDRVLQFALALLTFVFINNNIGFMKTASNPIVTLGLAVICTFLPAAFMVVLATLLTLVQFYTVSIGMAIVAAAIFILMFILYFRFTPSKTIVLLLTPIAFMLKIPVVIPIIYGLIGGPICIVPISLGTVVYFMISYVKSYATTYGTSVKEEMMVQITAFVKQLFNNKELWITVIAFAICLLVVYSIRRLAIDNSWAIGIVAGAVVHIIVMALGNVVMNTHISYVAVILGSVAATLIGLVAELFVFSVDYSRTEHLQFEDDEYYYYVKAVPKVSVSAPEKTVKRINERQETSMDVTGRQKRGARRNSEDMVKEQTDEMLLAKTLQDELDIQKIIEDELKF